MVDLAIQMTGTLGNNTYINRSMTLNNIIIEKVKQKTNLLFEKAGDFDLLSMYIYNETKRTIGVTTLKRLFNYIDDARRSSEYTLNTIAIYLGFVDWHELNHHINIDSVWGYEDKTIYVHSLEVGTHIEVTYLNRKVIFVVVQRNGKNILKVEKAENSSLKIGDECDIYKICKGTFLEAEHVYRESNIGNYKTQGEVASIKIWN